MHEDMQKRIEDALFFPVEKVQANTETGYGIRNLRTGEIISEVSNRYTLVENERIFRPLIGRFGWDNVKFSASYGKQKYTHLEIETGRRFDLGTPERPDIISERIVADNSYNKTRSFRFMFGAFRFVCTNGMYTGQAIINVRQVHIGEIPVERIVQEVINGYERNDFARWRTFRGKPLSFDAQKALALEFTPFQEGEPEIDDETGEEKVTQSMVLNNRVRLRAFNSIEKGRDPFNQDNAWGFLNRLNRSIADEVRGNSRIDQRITANKRAESFIEAFAGIN